MRTAGSSPLTARDNPRSLSQVNKSSVGEEVRFEGCDCIVKMDCSRRTAAGIAVLLNMEIDSQGLIFGERITVTMDISLYRM
ncbi:unnamed protein product [Urochloa humidicola]